MIRMLSIVTALQGGPRRISDDEGGKGDDDEGELVHDSIACETSSGRYDRHRRAFITVRPPHSRSLTVGMEIVVRSLDVEADSHLSLS